VEKPTKPALRPRSRRSKSELGRCQDCAATLTVDNWSPSMRGDTGQTPRHICKPCWTARQRRYDANKPPAQLRAMRNASRAKRRAEWTDERKERERRRRYGDWLARAYGITIDTFDSMYEAQSGACKICGTLRPRGKGGFHVDHCHRSNRIRGLLCAPCNMLLGLANDDKTVLARAIEHLTTFEQN